MVVKNTPKKNKKVKWSNHIKSKWFLLKVFLSWIIIILLLGILYLLDYIIYSKDDTSPGIGERIERNNDMRGPPILHKPNIYLYPEKKESIYVELELNGEIIADYPKYDETIKGWNVTAFPDGTIIDNTDQKEYSYLFWEWKAYDAQWNIDKWFIVKWSETRDFLQEILPKLGLSPKEYNEFVVYWYPLIQDNPYNLIHFSGKEYTDLAPLDTNPKYDSLLRVFMVVKPLETRINVEPQTFNDFDRTGFTVVEWGGTIIK